MTGIIEQSSNMRSYSSFDENIITESSRKPIEERVDPCSCGEMESERNVVTEDVLSFRPSILYKDFKNKIHQAQISLTWSEMFEFRFGTVYFLGSSPVLPSLLLFMYRLGVTIWGWGVIGNELTRYTKNFNEFIRDMENINFFLLLLYFMTATYHTTQIKSEDCHKQKYFSVFCWILVEIVWSFSFVFEYWHWAFNTDPVVRRYSITANGVGLCWILFELLCSRIQMIYQHVVFPCVLFVLYVVALLIHYWISSEESYEPVYGRGLDPRQEGEFCASCLMITLSLMLAFFLGRLVVRLRDNTFYSLFEEHDIYIRTAS